jgi:hypothetical protein
VSRARRVRDLRRRLHWRAMQRCGAALAVVATAFVAGLGVAPAAQARSYCGKLHTTYGKTTYTRRVYRLKGHVSCKAARRVIRDSMKMSSYGHPKGWECVMLHVPPPYDITCGSPRGAEDYSKAVASVLLGF